MIRAILFDIDGIIIKCGLKFSVRFSRDFSVPMEKIEPFFKNEFQLCLVGKADLKEEIHKYLADWGWTKSVDALLEYWFSNESDVDVDVISAIGHLREQGIKCYLSTNNEKHRTNYLLNDLGLGGKLDGAFSSSKVGYKKPEQEFWEKVISDLNLPKDEILVIDDSIENIKSAQRFGLRAELYNGNPKMLSEFC